MPDIVISDFRRGLNDFFSPFDIPESQYQTFQDVDNFKQGRVEKVKGQALQQATTTSANTQVQGQGHFAYRTEFDNGGTNDGAFWWLIYTKIAAGQYKIQRQESGNTGWNDILVQQSGQDWVDVNEAIVDMYAVNNILRISDANFLNNSDANNPSKWYGYIKRGIFGRGITYGSDPGRPLSPDQSEAVSEWYLKNQELVAPTVKKHTDLSTYRAFKWDTVLSAENEVGLLVIPMTDSAWPKLEPGKPSAGRGMVNDVSISKGGTGYTAGSLVFAGGGGGSGAAGTYTVSAGIIDSITITDNGSGYTEAPTVTPSDPGNDDASLIADMIYSPFSNEDRFAVTFNYDFVQESELSKNSDGELGISGFDLSTSTRALAFQVAVYTGTNGASWNNRITGMNIYWNPKDDEDWYLMTHLDIDKCASEEPFVTWRQEISNTEYTRNTGYWMPCFGGAIAAGASRLLANSGSGLTWNDTAHGQGGNIPCLGIIDDGDAHGVSTYLALNNPLKFIAYCASSTTNVITFQTIPINSAGQESTSYTGDSMALFYDPADGSGVDDIVCTMFLPFDGLMVATYQGLTGREDTDVLPAVRWQTSCVTDSGQVIIGNVNTKDENDQTVRERSRIYWTLPGRPDEFTIFNSRDIGKDDGDEIQALSFWNGRIWVFKDRNTYVYRMAEGYPVRVAHFPNIGCQYRFAYVNTPYGVVSSDLSKIALFSGSQPEELSLSFRSTYQGLTFDKPVMGYSSKTNELYFIPDTTASGLALYKFNFDTKSWMKQTLPVLKVKTNMQMGDNMEPLIGQHDTVLNTVGIFEFNDSSTDSTDTLKIKSKIFQLGSIGQKGRLQHIYCTYKTDDPAADALTVKVFYDGNTSADKTFTFAAQANITNVGKDFGGSETAKYIEVQFECAGEDFILEECRIRYQVMSRKLNA